jgi:hypothetical protein
VTTTKRTTQLRRLKQGTHHPGYVIGQHWMTWAYERICEGETEVSVMKDFRYVPEKRARKWRYRAV